MWDSPYQACRSETERISAPTVLAAASAIFNSGMTGPQIGFLDALVLRQLGIIALRQHLTARQHRDDVGQVGDHREIMFDHQAGVLGRDALDQRRDLVDVFMTHYGPRP